MPGTGHQGSSLGLLYAAAILLLTVLLLELTARQLRISAAALMGLVIVILSVTALILVLLAITRHRLSGSSPQSAEGPLEFARVQQRLMANISHELRTPLNVVLGYSEMLGDGTLGEMTDKQTTAARECHEAGQRILRMVTDILDIGRARSYAMDLDPVVLDPREFIERVMLLIAGQARAVKVTLAAELPDSLPEIEADERRFKQLVYHLVVSGMLRSPEEGALRFTAGSSGRTLALAATDGGAQMSDQEIAAVFAQAPATAADKGADAPNAVGWPLCVALARGMGGSLRITSSPEGTTAGVELPLGEAD